MSQMKSVDQIIADHEARNNSLRQLFLDRKIDLTEPRRIECHFWAFSREDAVSLSDSLRTRGFEISAARPAGLVNDPERWNVEAHVKQSIELTMRREFIDELARLADANHGIYDGWGTRI